MQAFNSIGEIITVGKLYFFESKIAKFIIMVLEIQEVDGEMCILYASQSIAQARVKSQKFETSEDNIMAAKHVGGSYYTTKDVKYAYANIKGMK
jgi:hypothetical protein